MQCEGAVPAEVRGFKSHPPHFECRRGRIRENELVVEYMQYLLKEGYRESTIESRVRLLKTMMKRCDVMNPESVKLAITKSNWSEGWKENAVWAYLNFATMKGLTFIPPRYKRVQKLPFIPLEEEVDILIGALNLRTAALCQLIKETGMRPGEAWALKWIDVDSCRNVVNVTREKNSNGRTLRISNKLASMLNELPRLNDTVFRKTFGNREMEHFRRNFQIRRRKLADKIKNPRIKKISFLTLRHWKATMEYHRTKDILHVMRMLGHKNIKNTLIYTHLIPDSKKRNTYARLRRTSRKLKP